MSSVYSASTAKSAKTVSSASKSSQSSKATSRPSTSASTAKTLSSVSRSSNPKSVVSQTQVPSKIAEDLLRLLRGSLTTERTKSVASVATSVQSTNSNDFLSQVELAILRSTNPIEVTETDEITVLGNRGIWTNKNEVMGWTGNFELKFK